MYEYEYKVAAMALVLTSVEWRSATYEVSAADKWPVRALDTAYKLAGTNVRAV